MSPRAYAPVMLELAQKGFLTVIVPMPLNLAFFGADRALNVMEKYPGINTWTIAGHSLGGAMACKFASEHAEKVDQLILLAAYTTKSFDLSDSGIPVLSVSASKDGLTTPEKINKNKPFLPPDTVYFEIEGGNHAQFGDYGMQFGDGKADINGTKQIRLTVEQILVFLEG